MTDKEKLEAVKAEIHRLVDVRGYDREMANDLFTFMDSLPNEPVSEVWHDASEEPDDMSHCLIYYGCKESVGHYLHYEPVLYNKREKMFITSSSPHPTGYKVEQKSFDGGCVAEVYKNRRDRISISDITQWCYLYDLHNLSNVQRTTKNWKEPVSEDLEEAALLYLSKYYDTSIIWDEDKKCVVRDFKAGALWQKENLWKPADGDDLPECDREVIAILDYDFGHYKVVYAHRPNPNGWDGTNIDTGEKEHFEPVIYDKEGWNQPHVLYWLDARLPYEENKIIK